VNIDITKPQREAARDHVIALGQEIFMLFRAYARIRKRQTTCLQLNMTHIKISSNFRATWFRNITEGMNHNMWLVSEGYVDSGHHFADIRVDKVRVLVTIL
jgi:hypothetical protein